MSLVSPGVKVSIIDQSQYIPAATNSVPYILLATASNKVSGAGTGIAAGTLPANANKVYLITSQRDLSATYGVPFFYQTTTGTPINGYELNEYGLLAAYSALGVTNQCYVQRVDIDLAALTATLVRPTGNPPGSTYWLDTVNTNWGIFQWNQVTGGFTAAEPIVITNTDQLETNSPVPLQTVGSIGNYAVTATNTYNPIYYKRGGPTTAQTTATALSDLYNNWVLIGSDDWKTSWATVQGTLTPTSLTAANTFTINTTHNISVPASPNNTVAGLSAAINSAGITGVYAAVIGGALAIFADSTSQSNGSTANGKVAISGTSGLLTALGITAGTYNTPAYQASPSYTVPKWNTFDTGTTEPTGSVWIKTNNVNQGALIEIKQYDATLGAFVLQNCPVYNTEAAAIYGLDPSSGGYNIPIGSTYALINPYNPLTAGYQIFSRYTTGPTIITGNDTSPSFTDGDEFTLSATQPGSATATTPVTVTINGTTSADFIAAVSAAAVPNVSASVNGTGAIVFTHSKGGDIYLVNTTGTPTTDAGFTTSVTGVRYSFPYYGLLGITLSNWITSPTFTYTSSDTAPDQNPDNGTYWYYSAANQVDIMVQYNGNWVGYQNCSQDIRGYDLTLTNASGPIISATAPTTQNNTAQSPLQYGDLWVNSSDLEDYPIISRWQNVNGVDQWVQLSNADQTTSNGILFADARWAPNGTTDPVADAIPTIKSLLTSNYLDPDAPEPDLYPQGMLLWNTRRSGFNVKTFQVNYFNNQDYPAYEWASGTAYAIGDRVMYGASSLVYICLEANTNQEPDTNPDYWALLDQTNAWVTASGNREDGSPHMGRQAQRAIIVKALKQGIDASTQAREDVNAFNLIACPQYPELAPNMVALNNDRGDTAFSIIDTPLRLTPADIVSWSTNNNGAGLPTGDGLLVGDSYAGTFYPSCQTTDLSGNPVVQPPSHMMVRTIIRSDSVSYPWLAPAGTQRGIVDNALQLGYINGVSGSFETLGVNQALRDVLYQHQVNPITFIPGVGITNFGNKTTQGTATALDRINVARLVAFLRGRLTRIAQQYLFQPNDQITRTSITSAITSLMIDLVAKRGLYDYLVVCDASNNTPATIDANELFVDIAIEPVKAVEFIYIPVRIQNTGSIANAATV